jgi:DNA-binding IclR family transcriptional regulator
MRGNKLLEVAIRIIVLLSQEPDLRQAEIARRLGECGSTVMRALPYTETLGVRLAEDEQGRLSLAER